MCYGQHRSKGLLLAAFNEQLSRSVKSVPTMFINGRQTQAWGSTGELLKAVCAAYTGASPPAGCSASNIERLSSIVQRQNKREVSRCYV